MRPDLEELISEFSSANIDFFLRKETINKNDLKTICFFLQDPPPISKHLTKLEKLARDKNFAFYRNL